VSKLIKSLMDVCIGDLQVGSFAPYVAELTATDEFLLPKCMGLGEASIARASSKRLFRDQTLD
jgi:hypothetical protein